MKKVLILIVSLLLSAIALTSCLKHDHSKYKYDDTYHSVVCDYKNCDKSGINEYHTYNGFNLLLNGDKQYVCTVCGYKRVETHTHTYSDKYTSNEGKHWQECTVEGCIYITEKENHEWSFTEVTKEPSIGEQGEELYTCAVCGQTKTKKLPSLPEKMSREEWESSFIFENVRIDAVNDYGAMGKVESYFLVDGELVLGVMEGEESYIDRSYLEDMDFSDYYDHFTNEGNGVYIANNIPSIDNEDIGLVFSKVEITFENGNISSVIYSIDMGDTFGVWTQEYRFSLWGEVTVEEPVLEEKMSLLEWQTAFTLENVMISYYISADEIEFLEYGFFAVMDELVYDITEESTTVGDRGYLSFIDYTDYYEYFYNLGEGIYYAELLTIFDGDDEYEITDITVSFDEVGLPYYICYYMNVSGYDISFEYLFSDWGDASLDFSGEEDYYEDLSSALSKENFSKYDCSMDYYVNDYWEGYTYYIFNGTSYEILRYENGNEISETGEANNAGIVKMPVVSYLLNLDIDDFYYDYESEYYVYVGGEIKNFDGNGSTATELFLEIYEGKLIGATFVISDSEKIVYTFHFYS